MELYRINMSMMEVHSETFPTEEMVGGRGLIDYLISEYSSPSAHPLSEEGLFVVAPGLLAGTSAPMSGRMSVGGKSPLTGGIKEANSGGVAAHKLGRLGIMGIMVEGRAKEWQILKVDKQGAVLETAGEIVGLSNYESCQKLRQRYGEKIGIIIIGTSGERKMANSTVAVTDIKGRPSRHCARGGVGAIMGSKGLKAIVVDDTGGALREPANKEAFNAAVKDAAEAIRQGPYFDFMHTVGTPGLIDVVNEIGNLPTNNHRLGAFDKHNSINSDKMIELNETRGGKMGQACMPGCLVKCTPVYHDASRNFVTAALEFETLGMLGSNLGIDDLDAIARMDRKCDEMGIDTIEVGNTIGILNDVGLFDFGDAAKAEAYLEEIAQGTPLGLILGSGTATTAKIFGIDRVPAVKGQGIPAHMARSAKGYGVTYATSPQGADHTAGAVEEELLSPNGHAERSRNEQIAMAALDSTGFCWFTFFMSPDPIVSLINAFYGLNWTNKDYTEMGKNVLRKEREFNLLAGIGPEQDRLPNWMASEPIPPTNAVFDVSEKDIKEVFNF